MSQKSVISGFEESPRVESKNDEDIDQDDEKSSQINAKFSKEISSSSEQSFRSSFLPAIIQVIIRTIKRIKYKFQTYLSYFLTLFSFNSENISIVLRSLAFWFFECSSRLFKVKSRFHSTLFAFNIANILSFSVFSF